MLCKHLQVKKDKKFGFGDDQVNGVYPSASRDRVLIFCIFVFFVFFVFCSYCVIYVYCYVLHSSSCCVVVVIV